MSISPSLSLRQCPDRYAFPAGQNLPNKDFCYLRTVIVMAAIHRGFDRRLPCYQVTNFLDLLALGFHMPHATRSERKLVMLLATGLLPSRVQHSTALPSSTTLELLSHNSVFMV
ncbi:hypothetical protein Tco_0145967 [Tanacetum coccineum]